jgi:hypothetical protein
VRGFIVGGGGIVVPEVVVEIPSRRHGLGVALGMFDD